MLPWRSGLPATNRYAHYLQRVAAWIRWEIRMSGPVGLRAIRVTVWGCDQLEGMALPGWWAPASMGPRC